ncbi:GH92 family glycosyl hydrolase [Georgenia sp. MJ206]|uniref:GH92 family glycosyl hydrolase n=1 Tax=Georgenia wangjunii TaxID=3117730 RepID=UPI002F269182
MASALTLALGLAGVAAGVTAPAANAAVPPAPGDFVTSFEAGDPQPAWTSTPETTPEGPMVSGVVGTTVLERSPSTPTGDDILGGATADLNWEGPFQNGVGSVPGTIEPTTTADGDPAVRWTMESAGETWIQVPMPGLERGVTVRAQATLSGSGRILLNVYSGGSDVGGQYLTLTEEPQTVTVDLVRPASGGNTPQFQIRTREAGTIDAVVSGTSLRRLSPGTVDFPGDITGTVVDVAASDENPPNEGADNLADGDVNTKWFAGSRTARLTYELAEPTVVAAYALASANDSPDRDPRSWELQGSSDGETWTTLDSRSNQTFTGRFETRQFDAANTEPYSFYRLDITENAGSGGTQLAELLLSTEEVAQSDMTTELGSGPSSAYTAKPEAGWTGVRSLHYAGSHLAEERGFSYNRVLDVDVPVGAESELSYTIFPQASETDAGYASTYVAVDLAFTDGTYLSELAATDQHGFRLSPQGQGDSKVLYVNQWNSVVSHIGAVAAGKTIDRVLVAYDRPEGPADFSGWVDDIEVVAEPADEARTSPSDYVVTTRGTNSSGDFSRGNTFPATAVPHGFNFWTPVTDAGTYRWLYEYQRRNDGQNRPALEAFSLSHEPSPWIGDRQTFQVMPSAEPGVPDADRGARALTFSHDNEVARAHYYGVTFDNGLQTEIAPTDHAAMFRFTFTGDESNLIFDNVNNDGGLTLDPAAGTLTGYTDVSSGSQSAGMTRMFVYAETDRPATGGGALAPGGRGDVAGHLTFDTSSSKVVTMRIATSLMSVEQARRNLELEIAPDDTFDDVARRAQALWDDKLDVIEVEGASEDQLTTLYSNLYRLSLYPNSGHENTGTAAEPVWQHVVQSSTSDEPAPSGTTATQTGAPVVDGKVYVNNGFWDTYRTTWPAYSLLYPTQASEMVNGFVQQYEDGGWVARWSAPGYANSMTGTSSDVAFADAYVKGVEGLDVQGMYDAALKNAAVAPPNENVGRKGLERANFLGYTPASTHESASWSLEDYLNDYGIATMSKKLLDSTDESDPRHEEYADNYTYYLNRALNYVHLFDPVTEFFRAKEEDGTWRQSAADFDPRVWGNEFTETDGWNFAFHAVQDGQGLANLYGGRAGLGAKLDEFFATPETATFPGSYGGVIHEMREAKAVRMGQWGLSNQVSHHIPYMYNFAGQPSKTQAVVREALARGFTGSDIGQGYPGDEDNGEMSAWHVFSALGFYPLQVGSPTYAIGSPLFTEATVHLENGEDLVLSAPDNSGTNVYIQGMTVDGTPQSATYLTHDQLLAGGTIEFDMGPEPSDWGTGEDDVPPSITQGDRVPDPLADATGPGAGEATTSEDGVDGAALFDDTSATSVTFASATPTVGYTLTGRTARAQMYTLTSADVPGDPTSWELQGSADGSTWTTLDERSGENFAERRETRAFSVAEPGIYRHYQLVVTASTGDGGTSLAEVELLAHTPRVSELSAVVDDAREAGRISAETAAELGGVLAAAQEAEDEGDADGVGTQLRALRAAIDRMPASELDAETRAELTLVLSQWLTPGSGLEEIRARIGELNRSGDIADTVAQDLQGLVTEAEEALAGSHSRELEDRLEALRAAIADAPADGVSDDAKAALLPLVDEMLANPPSVVRAARAAQVLMDDYDPEEAWWQSSWWNSAVAIETIVEYMQRTGDESYLEQVDRTFERNKAPFPAGELSGDELWGNFTSRAIDDAEWWALAWVQAYDLTGDEKYLDMAVTIGDFVHGYWDPSTCGGGVWWDHERTYKNAVTNGLWVRLTAELHNRIPGDTMWLERSQAGWDWLLASGMINDDGLVNDGLTGDCQNNGGTVWSYNQGLAIGAGLELHRATGNADVLQTVLRLADAGITEPELVTDGILTESCDLAATCDDNAKQFKGIFVRYLGDLNDTVDVPAYQEFIDRQAASIWAEDRTADDRLGLRWAGGDGTERANVFDWRTQASALSALLANIPAPSTEEPLDVSVETAARCVVGRTVLTARVTNGEGVPVSAEIATAYGTRSTASLEAGKSVLHAFTTRLGQVPAGEMSVTVAATVDGETVTEVIEVPYAAHACT